MPKCHPKRIKFYEELVHEWDIKNTKELNLGIGDFNGHVEKRWMDLRMYMRKIELGSKI